MTIDMAIKNCKVVRHDSMLSVGIGIEGGKIVALGADDALPPARSTIDAQGRYVLPGLVDAHVHLGYPPDVDPAANIRSETKAAAAGGVTTIIHMVSGAGDLLKKAREFVDLYHQNGLVDLSLTSAVHTVDQVGQLQQRAEFGISAFKFLLPYRGTESALRYPPLDDGVIYLSFEEIARLVRAGYRVHARVHCENVEIHWRLKERFLGQRVEPASWHEARPNLCEAESMLRCLYLAKVTGCPLCIVHMTIQEGLDIMAKARAEQVNVVAETCPQYLVLNVDNTDRVLSKVNPPIRNKEDNESLWRGISRGLISLVATDHSPTRKRDKPGLWDAIVGMPGVETWLPVMLSEGVNKGRLSLPDVVRLCCYNPARLYNLTPAKGLISVGSDADLTIIDLDKEETVGERPRYSGSDYSPFVGWRFKGWPVLTMLRGNVVMQDGRILTGPGSGRYVPGHTKGDLPGDRLEAF